MSKLRWVSWYQPSGDYRPIDYPPPMPILAWWCTGSSEEAWTLCAIVAADDAESAMVAVTSPGAWPDAGRERFNEDLDIDLSKPLPMGDRFPVSEWMRQRFDSVLKGAPDGR